MKKLEKYSAFLSMRRGGLILSDFGEMFESWKRCGWREKPFAEINRTQMESSIRGKF